MTKYHEILRLSNLNISQENIAASCGVSKKTVSKVLQAAKKQNLEWLQVKKLTEEALISVLFPSTNQTKKVSTKRMPDYEYIRKELLRNGVNKKLLWTEYLEAL